MLPAASSHLNPESSLILAEAAFLAPRTHPFLLIGGAPPGPKPATYDVSETRFEIRARRSSLPWARLFIGWGRKAWETWHCLGQSACSNRSKEKEENVLFAACGSHWVAFVLRASVGFGVSPLKTAVWASRQLAPCRMGHGILNMRQVSSRGCTGGWRGRAQPGTPAMVLRRAAGLADACPSPSIWRKDGAAFS